MQNSLCRRATLKNWGGPRAPDIYCDLTRVTARSFRKTWGRDTLFQPSQLSAPQRCNAERSDAQRNSFTSQFIPLFYSVIAVMPFPVFFSIARDNILHRAHHLCAFASIFPFATMVYCTKQQEIDQESQRSDVATGNAGWPSQTQTQRCGALSPKLDLRPNPQDPLRPPPPRNSLCTVFCWENQHLHKEFGRLSPLLDPPVRVPPKFFMQIFFGCFFRFVKCGCCCCRWLQ